MIERLLLGAHPDDKIQEISAFVVSLGLEPHGALVRIFNSGLLENMRRFGTDRTGVEKISIHPYLEDATYGYSEELQQKGLRFDDGVFAVTFDLFGEQFPDLFDHITLGISPHRIAIAIYRADLMIQINGEFFCFADPSQKQQALAGILVQPPHPVETAFLALSLEAKEQFLRKKMDELNRENIAVYFELARDFVHLARTNHLIDALLRAQDIFETIERREIEINVIDECWDQVTLLRENPNHPGISRELVVSRIRQRLPDASTAGQAELLSIVCSLESSG